VVALEVRGRRELDQVLVALLIAREQRQVVVAVALRLAVREEARLARDVHLAADHRAHVGLLAGLVQLDRAEHVAVVGQRERALTVLLARRDQIGDPVRAVEQAVLGVDVEVDEIRNRHRSPTGSP
jgi:hypothetical protein